MFVLVTAMDRIDELAAEVARLHARVARLEAAAGAPAAPAPAPTPEASAVAPAVARAASPSAVVASAPALLGRSLIVLGGAYLLRAATELAVVPDALGAAAGLVYALALLVLADRAAARDRAASSVFHAATAAAIAWPLVDELAIRFHVVGATGATALAAVVFIAVAALAHRRPTAALAWIAVAPPVAFALVLAAQLGDLVPSTLLLALVVAGATWLSVRARQPVLAWPAALAGDLALVPLVQLALVERSGHGAAAVVAAAFAFFVASAGAALGRSLIADAPTRAVDLAQVAVAFALAVLQGARVPVAPGVRALEAAVLVATGVGLVAVTLDALAPRPPRRAAAAVFGSLGVALVLVGLARVTRGDGFAVGSVVVAAALVVVSRRAPGPVAGPLAALHAVAALAAAAVGSQLLWRAVIALFAAPAALAAPGAVAFGVYGAILAALVVAVPEPPPGAGWLGRAPRLALIALAVACSDGVLAWALVRASHASPAIAATVRTALVGATAVALALASRHPRARSAALLVWPVLGAGALELVVGLRVGSAATLFFAFALYGVALIVAPHLRPRP